MSRLRQVAALLAIVAVIVWYGWVLTRPGMIEPPHPEPAVSVP